MSFLRALLALTVALGLQVALGKIWAPSHRYVDLLILPPVWYGIARGQRQAMIVGCAAGLMQDAWFHAGVFALNGFKRTLLGFSLGGLGSRVDLNNKAGRFLGGAVFSLADSLLELGLGRMLDLHFGTSGLLDVILRALITGLLALWIFPIIRRLGRERTLKR
jgi:rod shape-determining protein MreD